MNYQQRIAELEAAEPGLYEEYKKARDAFEAIQLKWVDCFKEIESLKEKEKMRAEILAEESAKSLPEIKPITTELAHVTPISAEGQAWLKRTSTHVSTADYSARPDPAAEGSPKEVLP